MQPKKLFITCYSFLIMKKFYLIISVFVICVFHVKAQDEIFLRDNSKLSVRVIDADSAEVKYRNVTDPNGVVESINAKKVKLVYYEDGRILNYSHPEKVHHHNHQYNPKEGYYKTHYDLDLSDSELVASKNVVFFNAAEILNSSLGVSYWRELFKSRVILNLMAGTGFNAPFIYNLNSYDYRNILGYTTTKKAFDVGAGLYFNTTGRGVLSHFIGASFRAMQYNGQLQTIYLTNITDSNGQLVPVANFEKHGFVYNETAAYLNNGLLFRVSPQFNIMMNIGVGMRSPKAFISGHPGNFYTEGEGQKSVDAANPTVQIGFNLGYRF